MPAENYAYPLRLDWTKSEMATVIRFYNQVEKFYENKIDPATFLAAYRAFKKIVPAKSEEKQLDREFEAASGYSIYQAVKFVQGKNIG